MQRIARSVWDVGCRRVEQSRAEQRLGVVDPSVLGAPLCGVSSGGGWLCCWLWIVEGAVSDHGVQGQDAAVGQGEDGLVMAFALVAFALVVGPGDGVGAQGGEGRQEHGSLEPLVACVGDASRP